MSDLPAASSIKLSSVAYRSRIDDIARQSDGRFVTFTCVALAIALAWSSMTKIDRVTRGAARIVPQTHKQEVQHLEGGIISEIFVKEGDRVAAGQPLMRIANSFFNSELAQGAIELATKRVRLVRLDAELAHSQAPNFDDEMIRVQPRQVAEEIAFFRARRANLQQQLDVLEQQKHQKEIEILQLKSKVPIYTREKEISETRLVSLTKLAAAGAASTNDRLIAESEVEQAALRLSDLKHDIPRGEAALAELQMRGLQFVSQFEAEAEKEREQTGVDIEKLTKNVEALQDRIHRSDVLAPTAGVINKLNVTTVGGVVKPGEALAEIVPSDTSIDVEMKLSPSDRGEIWPGQNAVVKVSAYETSSFGVMHAKVVDISPDALTDERGTPYFRVRLNANADALGPNHPVLPGMQADVDVIGRRESVLASLLSPLRRIRDNALRQ